MPLAIRIHRTAALVTGVFLLLVLAVAFAPQLAILALESWASGETGRNVVIDRATFHWGRDTTLELGGIRLANAQWANVPWMLSIDHLRLRTSLPELLRGHGLLDRLEVDGAALLLETKNGAANWSFADHPAPFMEFGGGGLPRIRSLQMRDLRLRFHDPARDSDITGAIAGASGSLGTPGWQIRGQGILDFKEIIFQLQGDGPELNLAVNLGDTSLLARGSVRAGEFALHATGADLRHAFPVIPIPFPSTPAYRFDARLTINGSRLLLSDLHGVLGDSDFAGQLTATLGSPPRLEGRLHSRSLHPADLRGFLGEPVRGPPPHPGRLFPDRPIHRQRLSRLRLSLDLHADEVVGTKLPLGGLQTRITVQEGVLRFDPFRLALADGSADGSAELDVREALPRGEVQLDLDHERLSRLVARLPMLDASRGLLRGTLRLEGEGASLADMFGASHGQLVLLMSGGALDRRFVDTLSGDLLQQLFGESKGKTASLTCAVAVFDVSGGVARADALVAETSKAIVSGRGDLDLGRERLDLTLAATPTEAKALSAPVPLTLGGSFAKPSLKLDTSELAGRAAAAVTLGALVGPLAAIAPFTSEGSDHDGECEGLLRRIDGHS